MASDDGSWWTSHAHVAPRLDEDRFQCSVPEWRPQQAPDDTADLSTVVWHPRFDDLRPRKSKSPSTTIDQHIVFARTLTEQSPYPWSQEVGGGIVPLESDEQVLNHVVFHHGNVARAKFSATAIAGCGRESHRLCISEKSMYSEGKLPLTNSLDYRDQPSTRELYGALKRSYDALPSEISSFPDALLRVPDKSDEPPLDTTGLEGTADTAVRQTGASEEHAKSSSEQPSSRSKTRALAAQPKDEVEPIPERVGRSRGTDKLAHRARWQAILDEVLGLIEQSEAPNLSARPPAQRLNELLDAAGALAIPEQSPGDTFVENIRVALLSTRRLLSRGRDWSARARDALCARGAAADVAMLEALVAESSSLPLRLADAEGLSASVALIKSWKSRSQRALQVKTDLREVVALVQDGEQFPFLAQQPEHGELQAKAHSAARLLAQLIEVLPSKRSRSDSSSKLLWSKLLELECAVEETGVALKEEAAFGDLLRRVRAWNQDAEVALTHSPDLKHLQQIIAAGDALPVAFPELINSLQRKLTQAEAWVERVRNAVPQKKTRKNADVVKAEFGEMKNLLSEGAGMQVDLKERDHMVHVVETAQDWIERVRGAINSGEDATLANLEELLGEADSIPVNMDEHTVLMCEIRARRWTLTVRDALERESTKYDMLQKLLGDFEAIRESMPLDARGKKSYKVPEETQLKGIISNVDAWRGKVKRALAAKKGTTVAKLESFLEEGAALRPVNLVAEEGRIKSIIAKAAEWRQSHSGLIDAVLGRSGVDSEESGMCETDAPWRGEFVAFNALEACIVAADKVNVQLDDLDLLKATLDQGRSWLDATEALIPKRLSKRTALEASAKPTEEELQAHLAASSNLPFDFAASVSRVNESIAHAHAWRQEARSALEKLAADCSEGDGSEFVVSADVSVFPAVPEQLLEGLRALLHDADKVSLRTDEESLVDKFLGIYSWCQDLRNVLDPASALRAARPLEELARIASAGAELYSSVNAQDVPPFLRPVVAFGEFHLKTLNAQLNTVSAWCSEAKKALDSSSGVSLATSSSLLETATKLKVSVDDVSRIGREVRGCFEWLVRAEGALSGNRRLNLNEFVALADEGEKMKVDQAAIKGLRAQVKQAKAWRAKVKRTGIEKGEATTAQLRALLPEAEAIVVDLSDEIRIIHLATNRYCICRKSLPEDLITCVACRASYHRSCIGGTGSSGLTCGRCQLRSAYTECVAGALNATARLAMSTETAGWAGLVKSALNTSVTGPPHDEAHPPPLLQQLQHHATTLGIHVIDDVKALMASFDSMAWYYVASEQLWGSPRLASLNGVVAQGEALQIHPSALEPLQALNYRANEWKSEAAQIIAHPPPGAFNLAQIKRLLDSKEHLPVRIPEERCLSAMLEDGGERYCTCRGGASGSFMIGCDHCDGWFHGKCVGVSAKAGDILASNGSKYMCPLCSAQGGIPYVPMSAASDFVDEDDEDEEEEDEYDISMKNAWLAGLWPPSQVLTIDPAGGSLKRKVEVTGAEALPQIPTSYFYSATATLGTPLDHAKRVKVGEQDE